MTLAAAAGIDAGKAFLDVALAPSDIAFRVPNSRAGIKTAIARLARAGIRTVVLEAIGTYVAPLVQALNAGGFAVGLVNPRRIKAFRDAEGRRAKTDRLDAPHGALRSPHARCHPPPAVPPPARHQGARHPPPSAGRDDRHGKDAPQAGARSAHRRQPPHRHRRVAQERSTIEAELDRRLAQAADLTRKMQIFLSVPGIGKQVATVLVTELPELGSLDRRAIASLAGVAPHIHQSGAAPPSARIGGGRPCVRAALYMAALSAARCDKGLRDAYQAMRRDGKPAKVALIAIARKLVTIANALAKTNQLFHAKPEA